MLVRKCSILYTQASIGT